jgi:hypothetical protein
MRKTVVLLGFLTSLLLLATACDEGIDDWNSSAKITGDVFTDVTHSHGVEGVKVILEADPDAQNPYEGPDRWVETDANGHFAGSVFLGNKNGAYNYVADMKVSYFWSNRAFSWSGGISVGPGSTFTLPAVDITQFATITGPNP